MHIKSSEELRQIYGWPKGRAEIKVLSTLDKHSINFIDKSPFLVLSTQDKRGSMDCSPRGGKIGFVHVLDDKTIVIPDSKGNNRVDSLINIVESGRVGILFLIPGIDETLRINGSAIVSIDQKYIDLFPNEKITPKSVLVINIEEAFLHCAKALMRSKLWSEDIKFERDQFPTMGRMLNDQLGAVGPEETHEEMVARYQKDL